MDLIREEVVLDPPRPAAGVPRRRVGAAVSVSGVGSGGGQPVWRGVVRRWVGVKAWNRVRWGANGAFGVDRDPRPDVRAVEFSARRASDERDWEQRQPVFMAGGARGSKGSYPRPEPI